MQRRSCIWQDGDRDPSRLAAHVEALEALVWEALDTIATINIRSRKKRYTLPFGLLQLRPPPSRPSASLSESSSDSDRSTKPGRPGSNPFLSGLASDGLDVYADPNWPMLRRADRLTWAVAAALADNQYYSLMPILRCDSLIERLKLVLHLAQRTQSVWMSLGTL